MKKKFQNIVDIIGGMIESGDLKRGERLPPERTLAQSYKVSRNTVREAIKTLAEKKVLITILGSGNFVAESGVELLRESLNNTLEKKKHRLNDIFELRKILEPQIASLAAQRIRPETLDLLTATLAQQEEALMQDKSTRKLDEQFHRTLAKATGNTILFHVYEKLQDIFSESRAEDFQIPERKQVSLSIHKDILGAIRDGDSIRAARKMKLHMDQIRKIMEKQMPKTINPGRKKTKGA
ncbi:MAG: FadR family transcriptional regulator [Proteobacteria bacterium]|nr:FadR family transcriptional regulator [Pseudomonadota bacterium]